jgi:hypothetical protein
LDIKPLTEAISFSEEKMKKNSLFDSPHLFYDLYCLLPGQHQKVHAHESSDKIYYVLEGVGRPQPVAREYGLLYRKDRGAEAATFFWVCVDIGDHSAAKHPAAARGEKTVSGSPPLSAKLLRGRRCSAPRP